MYREVKEFGQCHRVSSWTSMRAQAVSHQNPHLHHLQCHTATEQPSHPETMQKKVRLIARAATLGMQILQGTSMTQLLSLPNSESQ